MKKYNICILGNTGKNPFTAYSWFVKTVAQGFCLNGHNIFGLDYKSHTIEQIEKFLFNNDIDILFTHLTFHRHHDSFRIMELFDNLRRLNGTIVIHTMNDARSEPRYTGNISSAFDLALVGQYENIEKFQNYWKIPVYYWPYSGLTYSKMGEYNSKLDFGKPVFPGSPNSHSDRTKFLEKLKNKIDMKIIPTKSKEDIRDHTHDFSISNPCVLGLCTGYEYPIKGYFDVRPIQFLSSSAIMIMRKYENMDKVIPDELYYPIYGYDDKDADQVKEYWEEIKKKDLIKFRKEIFNFMQRYHSSKERMRETLEIIEEKRDQLDVFVK